MAEDPGSEITGQPGGELGMTPLLRQLCFSSSGLGPMQVFIRIPLVVLPDPEEFLSALQISPQLVWLGWQRSYLVT